MLDLARRVAALFSMTKIATTGGTVVSWANQMEELSELELAAPPLEAQHALFSTANEEDVFDLG